MTLAINIESYIKISVGIQTIVLNFGTESDSIYCGCGSI